MKKTFDLWVHSHPALKKLIMELKIALFIVLFSVTNVFATNTYSQVAKVTLNMDNKSLEQVMDEIETQSEFYFVFNQKQIDVSRIVNIQEDNKLITDILPDLFKGTNVNYVVLDRKILLTTDPLENSLLAIASGTEPQQKQITGTVTGKDGSPLPGVNVVVTGTTLGAMTDIAGKYSIEAPQGSKSLTFSFIGMESQEISIGTLTQINVTMAESAVSLEEVVVIGYGTQRKINLTGSVTSVSGEVMERIPVASASNLLAGRLPGLIAVNRSGEPGSDQASLSIRGFSNPLVIVDGIEQDFNRIDPNEIENISILKDASASIYGARAGNGVILITTKRGRIGKPTFNFSSSYGVMSPTRWPKMVDAPTYCRMYNDAEIATGRPPLYSEEEIKKYEDGTDPKYPNNDYVSEYWRKWTPLYQINLNTQGGSDAVTYFTSVGYLNQDMMLKNNDSKNSRFNIRSNIDAKLSKSFSMSFDLSGYLNILDSPQASWGGSPSIVESLFAAFPGRPFRYPDPSYSPGGLEAMTNRDVSGYRYKNEKQINGILSFNYALPFIEGLSAKGVFNYLVTDAYSKNWSKSYTVWQYDWDNDIYSTTGVPSPSQLSEATLRGFSMTTQLFLNYAKTFGVHDISAMVVGEFWETNNNNFSARRIGFLTTAIDQMSAGNTNNWSNDGSASEDGRIGYAGRLNYAYNGKYLAEATIRYDASARFIDENRWGLFPSLSLAWRLSKENFLSNIDAIDNLKLRASIGKAGNDYVGKYNFLTGYNLSGAYAFDSPAVVYKGIISRGLANTNLTWENTTTANIGMDGDFWKGMLSFELDFFYRKVTDVPGTSVQSLPSTFGADLPQQNINSFDDRGFELLMGTKGNIGGIAYKLQGNISWSRSKWIHYDEPVYVDNETKNRLQKSGNWKNRWFGYEALGLFQSQEEIDNYPVIQDNNNNTTLRPGDIKYADYNGDNILDWKDEHMIGRGRTPEIMFGLNLDLDYKGFNFSMLWQGAGNFNTYFINEIQSPFWATRSQTPFEYLSDYWTPENTDARFPRIYPSGAANNKYISTYWLQKSDYLRLKNIKLGYTLSKGLVQQLNLESVQLFLSAYNIFTVDNVYPFDPETGREETGEHSGAERGWYYPQQKSVSLGLSLRF